MPNVMLFPNQECVISCMITSTSDLSPAKRADVVCCPSTDKRVELKHTRCHEREAGIFLYV